jgi:hypothetical protein
MVVLAERSGGGGVGGEASSTDLFLSLIVQFSQLICILLFSCAFSILIFLSFQA